MKTYGFISFFAATLVLGLTLTSCDKEKADINQPDDGGKDPAEVEAFLPDSYADKTVAAWYSVYSEADYKKKIEAVFLFTDSTFIVTKSKVYTEEDGRDPSRVVMNEGKYQLSEGNFDNGVLIISLQGWAELDASISDGELTMMGVTYTKQDNAKVPAATRSTENEFIGKVQAYRPAFNIDISYAAWYEYVVQTERTIRIEAIFLETDSLMLYTRSMFYTQKDGRKPVYEVLDVGRYKLVEGDFSTGRVDLRFSTNEVFEATVTDGQMPIADRTFVKQDIADLPDAI